MRAHHLTILLSVSLIAGAGCETVTTEDRNLSMPEGQQDSYLDSELTKLEELTEKYPKRADYHYRIAGIHFRMEDYRKSAGALEAAIYLDPDQARYPYHLGRVHLRMGEIDKAEKQFRRALELTHSERYSGPRAALAYTLALKKDTAGAIEQFERCVEIEPDNPEFHYFLGALHDMRGETDEAIREFREYLEQGGGTYRKKAIFILESLGVIVEDALRDEADTEPPGDREGSVLPPPPADWPESDPTRLDAVRPLE